ncbi:MAG: flagellar hook-length control protein FliK [Thermodesulfobacteriota bacterium]|nr:flagellar hook-length control protein FliK [Thermodesulfobacteriota bacterium]
MSFKVAEILPGPILKLIGTKSRAPNAINITAILSALKENLWESVFENINQYGLPENALSRFKELINDLSLRSFLESRPDLLRTIIDRSGLSWEAKLGKTLINKTMSSDHLNKLIEGDLKGLLSKFIAIDEEQGVLLKRLASTIENIQILNQHGLEQGRKIFLPIPLQYPDGLFTIGQLLIHLPEEEKDESLSLKNDKNAFRMAFLLELSNLGPLRSDLIVRKKEIEGVFLISKMEVKSLIEKNIPSFVNNLIKMGFSVPLMECRLKDPAIINQSLIKEMIHEEGNTISLVA